MPSVTPISSRKHFFRKQHAIYCNTIPRRTRQDSSERLGKWRLSCRTALTTVSFRWFPKNSIWGRKRQSVSPPFFPVCRSRTILTKRSLRLLHSYVFTTSFAFMPVNEEMRPREVKDIVWGMDKDENIRQLLRSAVLHSHFW